MQPLEEEHEALIEDVLCGVRNEDDEEVRAVLERFPQVRERLERARAVARVLDDAGQERRRDLQRAQGANGDDGAVKRVLEPLMAEPTAGRLRPGTWGLLAAAVALATFVGLWATRGESVAVGPNDVTSGGSVAVGPNDEAPAELFLGAGGALVRPLGAVERYGPLEWTGEPPPRGAFRVRVYDVTDGPSFEPIDESERLTEPSWDPPAERTATWPDRIRWEVEWLDAHGAAISFADGLASRS